MIRLGREWFRLSAGVIFSVTGIAKVWSAWGSAALLERVDPIFNIRFSHLMLAAGILELAVAGVCIVRTTKNLATVLVAWLATCLLAYRLDLWWIGWQRPCGCLGNLTDALHVPPQFAENIMKSLLAYLLVGSYAILFHMWQERQRIPFSPASLASQ